jgi:hypothetical protein
MQRLIRFLCVSVLLAALAVSVADATQVLYRSPEQLGTDARLVVDGRVTDVRSHWNDTRTKIITEATVDVAGTYKGNAVSSVTVVQLGGVVGNVRQTVHGALHWQRGEEVLLFLEDAYPGTYQVAGFSQGKYRVERDDRGRPFVRQASPGGAELVSPQGETPAVQPTQIPLDTFLDQALGRK